MPPSYAAPAKKTVASVQPTHRIRIKLMSKNVRNLEAASAQFIAVAHAGKLEVRGPVRLPTKVLKITTHKSPCGEGTTTFAKFEMRIHSRIIEIKAPTQAVKNMQNISLAAGVTVEVTINDA
uniref:Small ribosomal subunit protein uS10 n=1 Tax=Sexangularia sp. CB-2014 TaxID=1486929 RepID=A0A7S1VGS0_9EUKA|mmetsp:Transcript_3396/g.11136  ORF Transcript_3396/g.11136 Transcript_3396/m.11136 type:complete len:122 (+) Transcript_3396:104-469(+)